MSEKSDEKNEGLPKEAVTQGSKKDPGPTAGSEPTPKVSKKAKMKKLFMPVEEYQMELTEAQRTAIIEQGISRYPNLFDIRGFKEDISSKYPFVEMSDAALLYTSLFEMNLKTILRKARKKKVVN